LAALAPSVADAKCSKYREVDIVGHKKKKKKKVPRVGKPERVFGGKVLLSKKRFPNWARSVNTYIGKIKKQRAKKFWENKDKKEWKIHFMAFFKRPLDDMEVTIKLYDVTTPPKRMLSAFEQYLDRCSTSYSSHMTLKREDFGVNKEILITVGGRGNPVMASGKFKILGEAEKYTGKADFTADEPEAAGMQEEDTESAADAFGKEEEPPPEEKMEDPLALTDDPDKELTDSDLEDTTEIEDLDPDEGMPKLPTQDKKKANKGCGCHANGGNAGGGLLLFALVLGALRVRRKW
jgi:MYXO-CTERM domain-containing protein